ncbi:MAG: DUF5069 domain-containing protein [Chthoniobacterales bacterium]|nr:MAG: DUF5069 domain-containing protein [Chthoniobacterales bacterium]PZR73623.1 MAG: DUF5069 domain-containing protein [Chthoniobacterales bacterium]
MSKTTELCSPSEKAGGIVYFPRMLSKIRMHARGELPPDYQPNLGKGFDESCVDFLQVDYNELVERVKKDGSDDEVLEWCFEKGRRPSDEEIFIWNEFMRKRGWNDEVTATLERRKGEAGLSERSEIQTMFDFIDADEGRAVGRRRATAVMS